MGLKITVPGVSFTNYVDIVEYPVTDALTSLFLLGTDSVTSVINHGSGADATGGGANITYGAGYARFAGQNTNLASYFQTTDLDNASNDMTLISLVMREDSNDRAVFGSYNAATNGASIGNTGAYTGNGALSVGTWAKAAPDTKYYMHAMTVNHSGATTVPYTWVDGIAVMGTPIAAARTQSSNGARIGGGYANSSWAGVNRISAAVKHTRILTLDELQQVYTYLKYRATSLGLEVS